LRADLTDRIGADTNADAEQAVLAAVAALQPDLARRLSVDSEAAAVQISAADPADCTPWRRSSPACPSRAVGG
jgi:hypothetical protein